MLKKRITSFMMAAVMAFSLQAFPFAVNAEEGVSDAQVISQGSWFESMYVEWLGSDNYGYNVYCKESGSEAFTKIDAELVRNTGDNKYRADVLGLKGGTEYTVEVIAVSNGTEIWDNPVVVFSGTPMSYNRDGFAFYNTSNCPGAYNADGTVPDNAKIYYVTESNKNSVENGKSLDKILSGLTGSSVPVIIRVIGNVTPLSSSKTEVGLWKNTCGLTIEGVGTDAEFYGWGISSGNNSDTEVRNLTFDHYVEDALGFQKAERLWIHNNTFYQGYNANDTSSERDKLHGDGSCDLRECDYVTVDYNHFKGTDKTSLIGSSASSRETTGNITFHHNFFEETSQRTPRVRWHNIHAYNNYYLNTKTYGIGATCNSSIFAENNYFENASSPMLTSSQGGYGSKFSDNEGGVIKAYGNVTVNCRDDLPGVDYFVAPSKDYVMTAEDFTTKKGGWTYNNFDTGSNMYKDYELDSAEAAKEKVLLYAGRLDKTEIESITSPERPSIDGNIKNIYYYDSAESGSTGTAFGGENGEGEFFTGSGYSCSSGSASGWRNNEQYSYSGKFTANSKITFTVSNPGMFYAVVGSDANAPVRITLQKMNGSSLDDIYEGTFQTGSKGGNVYNSVLLQSSGTYVMTPKSSIYVYYLEVDEYDCDDPQTTETTTETTTQTTANKDNTTESTTENTVIPDGIPKADYFYIPTSSGSGKTAFGGENGSGEYFVSSSGINVSSRNVTYGNVEYSKCFSFGNKTSIDFTTSGKAVFKLLSDTSSTSTRKIIFQKKNSSGEYEDVFVFYSGSNNNVSLQEIDIDEAGSYRIYNNGGGEAKVYFIGVEETKTKTFIYGDADGNCIIDSNDAAVILEKALNKDFVTKAEELYPNDFKYILDVDLSGDIEANDAALVLGKALDLSQKMPCEK